MGCQIRYEGILQLNQNYFNLPLTKHFVGDYEITLSL